MVNKAGSIGREDVVDSDPKAIAAFGSGADRPRDGADFHVGMDRAQAAWPAGDLYRRAPRQAGISGNWSNDTHYV
jgi:hypothetical protein